MTRKKLLILFLFTSSVVQSFGQERNVREQAYLHLNTPFLLTGETLYFSGYVTSEATGKPSLLSSILYVELVGENDQPVFQKKIRLSEGRAQGEFFVSSMIPTGTYQLLAYTRWMKNFNDYYQVPITIVNPFEEYTRPEHENSPEEFTFFPEGGELVAGRANVVVVKGTGEVTGRVVNAAGEKQADIAVGANGYGRFTFTPATGEAYQAIVEDQLGNFQFFSLPTASSKGKSIQLESASDAYRLNVLSTENEEVRILVTDGQNVVLDRETYTNDPLLLGKRKLEPGVYRISVSNLSGEQLASRLFIHEVEGFVTQDERLSETFRTRSQVRLPIELGLAAEVSVSVRKVGADSKVPGIVAVTQYDHLDKPPYEDLESKNWEHLDNLMIMSTWKQTGDTLTEVSLLPELRGELISGRISSDTQPVADKIVAYAISGEQYQVQTAVTDEDGNFLIRIDPFQGEWQGYLTVLDGGSYSFDLDASFLTTYPEFDYTKPALDSATIAALVQRSVRNQIENAYYEFRADSVFSKNVWQNQFGNFNAFYLLDDFNRFPEMYEHFVEYIPLVVARKNKNRSKIKVLQQYMLPDDKDPLILLDGVPATAEQVLDFNPYKVESIGVINNRFFLGPLVADGIVAFHTFENDLQGFDLGDNAIKVAYQGLEPVKKYSFPEYDVPSEVLERRPDYRDQLYWNPAVSIEAGTPYALDFYTSDTTGEFEVVIEGYTVEGAPVSIRKTFVVTEANLPASN